MMTVTKAQIDRLGDRVREETGDLSDATVNSLQDYRTSHKLLLSEVFNAICLASKQIQGRSIVTYRIKRFQSIISKLSRLPEMRFSRMWDIGGCRCIVNTDDEVYRLKSRIEEKVTVLKVNDYIENPREDGYRSLHLYVTLPQYPQVVEIQLRSIDDHNWATLVEITDLLYGTTLKEYDEKTSFSEFHYLLSLAPDLTITQKKQVINFITNKKYIETLTRVFTRNYLKVRKRWLDIQNKTTHQYFLIESNKEEVPSISSFAKFADAELQYFQLYKSRPDANAVLTHLPYPSYSQISIAYSNYILTYHDTLNDCHDIYESLILDSLNQTHLFDFMKYLGRYWEMNYVRIKALREEAAEVTSVIRKSKNIKLKKKEREWATDLNNQIKHIQTKYQKFQKEFDLIVPKNRFKRFVLDAIMKYNGSKYSARFKKVSKLP